MRFLITVVALTTAAALEATLLQRIVEHPGGGTTDAAAAFRYLFGWALIPLVVALGVASVAARRLRPERYPLRVLLFVAAVGPLLTFIALSQYSHATPGFLLLGFLGQWIGVIIAAVRVYRGGTSPSGA